MLSIVRKLTFTSQPQIGITSFLKFYSTVPSNFYQEKLLKKAKEEGFDTVDQLKDHLQEQIKKQQTEFQKNDPLQKLDRLNQKSLPNKIKTNKPLDSKSNNNAPFKTLTSYLDLDKFKKLSTQEMEYIWKSRWSSKDNTLVAVIPQSVFQKMKGYAKENPSFVLPLIRKDNDVGDKSKTGSQKEGMELQYVQWNFPNKYTTHCIITSLAEYKLHNQFARPHTVLEFHSELEDQCHNIFMNGHIEEDCNVTLHDSQLLLLNIQRFYGAMEVQSNIAKERIQLLKQFNQGSIAFNVERLIELSQSMEN